VKKISLFILFSVTFFLQSCGKIDDNYQINSSGYPINWSFAADSCDKSMVANFWDSNNSIFYGSNDHTRNWQGYWTEAHALDVMVDAYNRTKNTSYSSIILAWYDGVKKKNGNTFQNNYYDDMSWNALATLRAYNSTNDTKFKDATNQLWSWIQVGWSDNICGGGICWTVNNTTYKNVPVNGPATILAARLYEQFNDVSNKTWALKLYSWMKDKCFDQASGLVYDGVNQVGTQEGTNKTSFTYNQGTFIGAALEIYKITSEPVYLNDAVKAADYTLRSMINTNNQILVNGDNSDGGLFNGIFIRYFTQLIQNPNLDSMIRKRYIAFIKHNAEMLWYNGTNKSLVLFGPDWTSNPGMVTYLTPQLSGCMLIESMAMLSNAGLLN